MALGNGRRMSELFELRLADWSRVEAVLGLGGSGEGSVGRLGSGSLTPAKKRHGIVCVLEVYECDWMYILCAGVRLLEVVIQYGYMLSSMVVGSVSCLYAQRGL